MTGGVRVGTAVNGNLGVAAEIHIGEIVVAGYLFDRRAVISCHMGTYDTDNLGLGVLLHEGPDDEI